MPSSFLPAIPASLPSYPSYHGAFRTQTSPSPTLAPTRKRFQQRRPGNSSYTASTDADRDSDEDVMRNSLYSDTAFRTTLSRKRGLADDDTADDYHGGKRIELADEDGRPAKRRIIDVVGSVASRVWEFCISKTPFFAPQDDGMEFEREVQQHMGLYMPSPFSNSPQLAPPSWSGGGGGQDTGMGGTLYSFHAPPVYSAPSKPAVSTAAGGLSSRWVMVSPTPSTRPSTATATASITPSAIPRPYTAPSAHAPYNPTTYATTATSATTATASTPRSRRNSTASVARRPATRPIVASSSRAKRPAVVRHKHSLSSAAAFPAPPSQSAFTFGSASSSPARAGLGRRKLSIAGGRAAVAVAVDDEDDEEDESIRRFNEKLKDMIREGREALGSRIEVTYDDDDDLEGF